MRIGDACRFVEGPPLSGDGMGRMLWRFWASRCETNAAVWMLQAVCLWAEAIVDLEHYDVRRAVDSTRRAGALLAFGFAAAAAGRFCRWQA